MDPIEELTKYISLEDIPSSWANCYEDMKKSYNADWLEDYDFNSILSYYEFEKDFKERFYTELKVLKQDNKLNMICFIMYYILFLADMKNYYDIWSWKSTDNVFKNNGSYMIPVVALLCGCKFHVDNIKTRNFDEEQIKLQKYNIRSTCTNDSILYNIDGIRFSQMIWGSFFMKGRLIQIGRLQYEVDVENFDKLDKYFDEKHQYVYIHIPRDRDLEEQNVDKSFSLVDEYIKRYYPELKGEKLAYYTQTWLLSPEIKEILSADCNIIKFQNRFNVVEYEENLNDFLNFVFDDVLGKTNYDDLPERTILQRELKKQILNGTKLHLGLGILKKGK